jgi:peroxin-5
MKEWGDLQDSWDSFEATASGIRQIPSYQFQPHNPYLAGAEYRTRNHMAHMDASQAFYEVRRFMSHLSTNSDIHKFVHPRTNQSVLELEAKVQRDPHSASAWFDLGVKQQENEREAKAILALKRALDLDPSHLNAWLALAVSHTNESERTAADDAIEQWVLRNPNYKHVTEPYFEAAKKLNGGDNTLGSLGQVRRHSELIDCLMAMARNGAEQGVVDADVQIALAVLLNTSEDYKKAQDCFRAALAVRPDVSVLV